MAKIELLAIVSLDGCISNDKGNARWVLNPENYGIDIIRGNAICSLSPDYPTVRLTAGRHEKDNIYLIEADKDNLPYIQTLMRMGLIDEIILYTYPVLAGTGLHVFGSKLPMSYWELTETKCYKSGITRSIFRRSNPLE